MNERAADVKNRQTMSRSARSTLLRGFVPTAENGSGQVGEARRQGGESFLLVHDSDQMPHHSRVCCVQSHYCFIDLNELIRAWFWKLEELEKEKETGRTSGGFEDLDDWHRQMLGSDMEEEVWVLDKNASSGQFDCRCVRNVISIYFIVCHSQSG